MRSRQGWPGSECARLDCLVFGPCQGNYINTLWLLSSAISMTASHASDPMLAPQLLVLGYCFHENELLRLGRYHAYAFLTDIEETALAHTRIAGFLKQGDFMKLRRIGADSLTSPMSQGRVWLQKIVFWFGFTGQIRAF
jgi:hypothetical protein